MSHLLHPLIVDFIADEAAAAGDAEAEMPGATGNADTATRQTTHRTQMSLLADAAGVDLATFVQETATGSTLERLGLVGFRGGRDEVADINISRPMLFALRSNTLDDLKAGLFDETPPAAFVLSQFSISPEETRTCAAALRGGHSLLISGEPGIGKTEFARALVHSLVRQARTLAAATRSWEHSQIAEILAKARSRDRTRDIGFWTFVSDRRWRNGSPDAMMISLLLPPNTWARSDGTVRERSTDLGKFGTAYTAKRETRSGIGNARLGRHLACVFKDPTCARLFQPDPDQHRMAVPSCGRTCRFRLEADGLTIGAGSGSL